MALIHGKQLRDDSILPAKLDQAYEQTIILSDGSRPMAADLSMGGNKLTNLAEPTGNNDAARKIDIDRARAGLDVKQSVRIGTIVAGTLGTSFAAGQTVDGKVLVLGDRILIKNQVDPIENGIYDVTAGAPTRSSDFDGDITEGVAGAFTFIEEGSQADTGWVVTSDGHPIPGVDPINWTQFSGTTADIQAGDGLTKTGNVLSVNIDPDKALEFTGSEAKLAVKVNDNGGLGFGVTDGGLEIKPADTSVQVDVNGLKAAVPTKADKNHTCLVCNNDGDQVFTGGIAYTPSGDGMVCVLINGVQYILGDGVKTTDCYFSNDGGTTARAITAIAAGDTLHWNRTIAGFRLDAGDHADLNYNVIV